MDAYGGMGVRHHVFVIMVQDGNEQSVSHFSPFTSEQKNPYWKPKPLWTQ
jgi:hypothetical protein